MIITILGILFLHFICAYNILILRNLYQAHFPELSAVEAGDRRYDVYMGIDAFGRGTFGGGQWNVCISMNHSQMISIYNSQSIGTNF